MWLGEAGYTLFFFFFFFSRMIESIGWDRHTLLIMPSCLVRYIQQHGDRIDKKANI